MNIPAVPGADLDREPEGTRYESGKFKKGGWRGISKPKGSRRKFSEKFLFDFLRDWKRHGMKALVNCREKDPATYVRVAASLLPKDINLNVNPIEQMDDDQLLSNIRQLEIAIRAAFALPVIDAVSGTENRICTTIGDEETPALPRLS